VMYPNANYCDDGNTVSKDGCSATCVPETDLWSCTQGDTMNPSKCTDICGDGVRSTNTNPNNKVN